ncbi:hypothetical protein X765_22210 [Mesorhizobium sp. LSHC440B00]|nr:hypothetical protein X765_22210 [Mesorhizobium sp. LSHC440B00]
MTVFGLPLATLIDAFVVDETWTISLSALAGALRPSIAAAARQAPTASARIGRSPFVVRNA